MEEATSARVAQNLAEAGFQEARPILGGFEALKGAGFPVVKRAVPTRT